MSEVKTAEISVQENIVPCRSSQGNYTDIFRLKSKVLSWTEWCPPPPAAPPQNSDVEVFTPNVTALETRPFKRS